MRTINCLFFWVFLFPNLNWFLKIVSRLKVNYYWRKIVKAHQETQTS